MRALAVIALVLLATAPAVAQPPPQDARPSAGLPEILRPVAFDQRLGAKLPLDLEFQDEQGRTVRLGDYFGARPVILVLAYYTCPMLCHEVLLGTVKALSVLRLDAGREFDVVVFLLQREYCIVLRG